MTNRSKEEFKDIISDVYYKDSNPIYQKIKEEFTNKLKEKYQCEDYDTIVDYVFDHAFKKKVEKSKCIETMNSIFNNNASPIIDYLWKITKDAENEQENNNISPEEENRYYNNKKGGKPFLEKYKGKGRNIYDKRQAFNKKRERSRSYSKERMENKYEYENYQNFPMQQKGFYPPKRGFGGPMMPMGGAYPPYYPPQMMPPYMR